MKKLVEAIVDSAGKVVEQAQNLAGSAQSSRASLGAAHEAYAVLEAHRRGPEAKKALYDEAAAEICRTRNVELEDAMVEVGQKAKYLLQVCSGDSLFHAAKDRLDAQAKAAPSTATNGAQPNLGNPAPSF